MAVTNILSIAERLEKTFRLMASDNPGEVMAAKAAMERLLKSVDADWHDLANLLAAVIRGDIKPPPQQAPPPPVYSPPANTISWKEMARWSLMYRHLLREKEVDFLEDMLGWRYPTPKQKVWLTKIYLSLGGEKTPGSATDIWDNVI